MKTVKGANQGTLFQNLIITNDFDVKFSNNIRDELLEYFSTVRLSPFIQKFTSTRENIIINYYYPSIIF